MPGEGGRDGPLLGGRFRLGPRLGAGTQAETFVAVEVARREEVVVKRVRLGGGWKSFELHERETKVLGQLRHPGIPRLKAAFEEPPGTFNLVMQRMPGENLRELWRRTRPGEVELRDVLVRGLEILDYLATRSPPVVHRDIKPTNLVRDRDGTLALVDFGGVADARSGAGSTLVGTFGYMAPEQLHGEVTPATDLYALGATVVALAGGVEPEDVPRKGLKMDLARHLPSMSPGLRRVLEAMTEPDPERRPQRPRDVVAMLARAVASDAERAERAEREARGRRGGDKPARPAADSDDGRARADRALVRAPSEVRLARPIFTSFPEPLGALMRLALLGVALGGWLGLRVTSASVRALGWLIGSVAGRGRTSVRHATGDLAGVLDDGGDGFRDLAARAVAPKRRRR